MNFEQHRKLTPFISTLCNNKISAKFTQDVLEKGSLVWKETDLRDRQEKYSKQHGNKLKLDLTSQFLMLSFKIRAEWTQDYFLLALCKLMGSWGRVCSNMANQIDVVIEMTREVSIHPLSCPACVFDKLSLGHFVFDVWAGQVDGKHDEWVTQDKHSVWNQIKHKPQS